MCVLCEQFGENGDLWYLNPKYHKSAPGDDPSTDVTQGAWYMDWPNWQGVKEKAMLIGEYKVHQLVPIEDVMKLADLCQANSPDPHYHIVDCACVQMTTGLNIPKCTNFGSGFGMGGKGEEGVAIDEWKEKLIELDKQGYVHSLLCWGRATDTVVPNHICNCKMGTCMPLKARELWGVEHQNYKAHYIAEIDAMDCNGCGLCAPSCQFGAVRVDGTMKLAYIDPRICYGCGVCRQRCKKDAISLRARADVPVARNLW